MPTDLLCEDCEGISGEAETISQFYRQSHYFDTERAIVHRCYITCTRTKTVLLSPMSHFRVVVENRHFNTRNATHQHATEPDKTETLGR